MSDELDLVGHAAGDLLNDPTVREFLSRVSGEPAEQLGGLVGDRIGWWRFKQAVRLAVKAKALLEDAGIEPQRLPTNVWVPLLEAGSLPDDGERQRQQHERHARGSQGSSLPR